MGLRGHSGGGMGHVVDMGDAGRAEGNRVRRAAVRGDLQKSDHQGANQSSTVTWKKENLF